MNAVITETKKATVLGLGMQISEIPAKCKFVSSVCGISDLVSVVLNAAHVCHAYMPRLL